MLISVIKSQLSLIYYIDKFCWLARRKQNRSALGGFRLNLNWIVFYILYLLNHMQCTSAITVSMSYTGVVSCTSISDCVFRIPKRIQDRYISYLAAVIREQSCISQAVHTNMLLPPVGHNVRITGLISLVNIYNPPPRGAMYRASKLLVVFWCAHYSPDWFSLEH